MRRFIALAVAATALAVTPTQAGAGKIEECFGEKVDIIIDKKGKQIAGLRQPGGNFGYEYGTVAVYQKRARLFFDPDGDNRGRVCVKADNVRLSGMIQRVHSTGKDTRVNFQEPCDWPMRSERPRYFHVYQVDIQRCTPRI